MTARVTQPILLVGSIAGDSAAEVMDAWGAGLANRLAALPDGEPDRRRAWVTFLAAGALHENSALETLRRPVPYDPNDPREWRGPDGDWIPLSYEDQWLFKPKDDATSIRFETLGYAQAAMDSYRAFTQLRDQGAIPAHLRFQICLPMHESGLRVYLTGADDLDRLWEPYGDGLKRDLATIFENIPANEVSIQWDVCVELLGIDPNGHEFFPWPANGDDMQRCMRAVADLSPQVPTEALLGIHLCYGDLGHKHMVEPVDLGISVDIANAVVQNAGRQIDFVHMPVPRDRVDDAYFEPLKGLAVGDAKLYLGLLHTTGGLDDNMQRLATAQRHATNFGVATECGFGRRPAEQMPELMEIHRAVADAL